MTESLNPFAAAPELMRAWLSASTVIGGCVEPKLGDLVKIRASQINGCANCINMHTVEARHRGETEQRLYLVSAWREAPCFDVRERAALGWTEALTRLSEQPLLTHARAELARHFDDAEQIALTMLINVINGFNRLALGFNLWADSEPRRSAA
jgi:AhpD family alkylhydroperoxidase